MERSRAGGGGMGEMGWWKRDGGWRWKRKRKGGWQNLAPVDNAPLEGVNGAKGAGGGPLAAATPSTENCFSFVFIVWRSPRGEGSARKSQLKM